MQKYQRQIILPNFGVSGQKKLRAAKVLVIGAGGLGCPALQYLAAAGVGHIGIIDDDRVSETNLHRQILYGVLDIGLLKTDCAKKVLKQLNPDIDIQTFSVRLTAANAFDLLGAYDWILDGSDNFATRYLVNDACFLLKKILVFGAVSQWEGQVAVFNYPTPSGDRGVNYRDIFPQPPLDQEIRNCAEAGVLGVVPGLIGTMMANETIKLIVQIGTPLTNQLLTYNVLNNNNLTLNISPNEDTLSLIPKDQSAFESTDYNWLCGHQPPTLEITAAAFKQRLAQGNITVIDVREFGETPKITAFEHQQIPLSVFREQMSTIRGETVVLICQAGIRSLTAAKYLSEIKKSGVYSLKRGLLHLHHL